MILMFCVLLDVWLTLLVLRGKETKLDTRSRKCIYLGNQHGVISHVLFDINNKHLFLSCDTIFFEHISPYNINNHKTCNTPQHTFSIDNTNFHDDIEHHSPSSTPTTSIQSPTPANNNPSNPTV